MTVTDGLRLTPAQWRALTEHLTRELPNEACGLLGGLAGEVQAVYPVTNQLRSPVAYEMDPAEQIQAMLAIEDIGWEITAIFHSHPAGPPAPSPTDIAQAFYPESIYLICVPAGERGGRWHGRAFRILDGQVGEVPFVIRE
jgi:proteasome lid subunit RPN8/RPN11